MGRAWAGHGLGGAHVEYEEAVSAVTLVRSLRALAITHAMALRTEMGFRASGFPKERGGWQFVARELRAPTSGRRVQQMHAGRGGCRLCYCYM